MDIYLIPLSEDVIKDDPRYYLMLCEIHQWIIAKYNGRNLIQEKEQELETLLNHLI